MCAARRMCGVVRYDRHSARCALNQSKQKQHGSPSVRFTPLSDQTTVHRAACAAAAHARHAWHRPRKPLSASSTSSSRPVARSGTPRRCAFESPGATGSAPAQDLGCGGTSLGSTRGSPRPRSSRHVTPSVQSASNSCDRSPSRAARLVAPSPSATRPSSTATFPGQTASFLGGARRPRWRRCARCSSRTASIARAAPRRAATARA